MEGIYDITKAGVFRLELRVPARWSVAEIGTESAVEDFQIAEGTDATKTITVNLKSKALGAFRLPFRLTAEGSAAQPEVVLVPPVVVGSQQDRGLFGVTAPKAFTVSTTERDKVTSADDDALFRSGIMKQVGADMAMPLAYGYREPGASVKIGLEAKKTEIDVLGQHLIEIADGGIRFTHILDFVIKYAAVDRLTFSAPTEVFAGLKVETKDKKEIREISRAEGKTVWEIELQAPVLGAVSVTMHHEVTLDPPAAGQPFVQDVPLIHALKVSEKNGLVAMRQEGTLQIVPVQSGMEPVDPGELPDTLRGRGQIYSAFRYFTADPALSLQLTRYEYQTLATTVVNLMRMKSVLSEERRLTTQVVLFVQNTERQYLEIRFAPQVNILSISVAGKPQKPRQRKDETATRLLQIPASAGPGGTFEVVIVYEEQLAGGPMKALGTASLRTPEILGGVPVAKVELALFLSPEFAYLGWGGTLKPTFLGAPGLWSRFKHLVNTAVSAENRATPVSRGGQTGRRPGETAPQAGVDIDVPTRGYVQHDFETLASPGDLRVVYVGRALYTFLDFLAFLVALAGGYVVMFKLRLSKLTAFVAVIFVPLALVWFSRGAIVEIFTSFLLGGIVLCACVAVAAAARALREYRQARLAFAPDPFLEDVEAAAGVSPEAGAPEATEQPDGTGAPEPPSEEGDGSGETDGTERS